MQEELFPVVVQAIARDAFTVKDTVRALLFRKGTTGYYWIQQVKNQKTA